MPLPLTDAELAETNARACKNRGVSGSIVREPAGNVYGRFKVLRRSDGLFVVHDADQWPPDGLVFRGEWDARTVAAYRCGDRDALRLVIADRAAAECPAPVDTVQRVVDADVVASVRRGLAAFPVVDRLADVCPGCGQHMIADDAQRLQFLRSGGTTVCPRCGISKAHNIEAVATA